MGDVSCYHGISRHQTSFQGLEYSGTSLPGTSLSILRGMALFQGVNTQDNNYWYRGVLISGCWNRGVPLYTEVSSFQGVGIEEFHCIQRCPHFRVLE